MEMLPASHFPEGEKKKNHDTLPHKKVLGKGVLCVCLAVGGRKGGGERRMERVSTNWIFFAGGRGARFHVAYLE